MGFLKSIGKVVGKVAGIAGLAAGNPAVAMGADFLGNALTNSAKASAAKDANAFSAYMSNTSYQRAVEDMKAAGVNPALAYSQGGASAPTGQQADVEGYSQSSGKAIQNMATAAQIANTKAQTNSIDINAAKTIVDRKNALLEEKQRQLDIQSSKLDLQSKASISPRARAYLGAIGQATNSARDVAGAYGDVIRSNKLRDWR